MLELSNSLLLETVRIFVVWAFELTCVCWGVKEETGEEDSLTAALEDVYVDPMSDEDFDLQMSLFAAQGHLEARDAVRPTCDAAVLQPVQNVAESSALPPPKANNCGITGSLDRPTASTLPSHGRANESGRVLDRAIRCLGPWRAPRIFSDRWARDDCSCLSAAVVCFATPVAWLRECSGAWVEGSKWSGWGGGGWSGVEWSGVEWSGVEWNGVAWLGVAWRGVVC